MDRAYIDYEKLEELTQHGITYVTKTSRRGNKEQEVQLLTNSHDLGVDEVIAIYQRRWQIESLFKQLKQNFPLRYFYGVSENAIKIQIWVTLIANLLLTLVQRSLERHRERMLKHPS